MKRVFSVAVIAALAILLLLASSCWKEGDDNSTTDKKCTGNSAPQLHGPYILKNNGIVDPDERTFTAFETIGVAIDYYDSECNLNGGRIWASVNPSDYSTGSEGYQDFQPILNIPSWIGCEGYANDTESNILGFDVRLDAGEQTIRVGLEDSCGKRSKEFGEITLSVVADR
jgi:hypothetical protein